MIREEARRCEILGRYIIENKATVRDTAKWFGVSKSTVHKDVTERLRNCNGALCGQVREILDENNFCYHHETSCRNTKSWCRKP